ncbi:hypothetical protein ORV05_18660 [Amycolatopsis cynarae]|uniref:SMI1/KNR4 family protein n=1 Tax=Amycolatopsis cynarae TaxID=2995223 RepID=A0ABY7ASZ6_9PSEU|nr:hypothetical protein [Amycolatopsis sp. HUAS 11-8]WAL63062.1 hypothetical protein ORV05_18660 [Amycolatopsis sp. HUAS 11-8]
MPETMEELAARLVSLGWATRKTLVGCSPEEVDEVRRVQQVERLPSQYEQFLLTMGKRAGVFLRGSSFFYREIVEIADEVSDFLEESNVTHLMSPGSVFVGMHQGYELYWLEPGQPSGRLNFHLEGEEVIRRSWPTLLDFLAGKVEEEKQIIEWSLRFR